jgi:uncharacterized membrane protein YkgB
MSFAYMLLLGEKKMAYKRIVTILINISIFLLLLPTSYIYLGRISYSEYEKNQIFRCVLNLSYFSL